MAKTAKKLPKDGEKLPQFLFKHLKYALLFNNILRPFKNNLIHTRNGQKRQNKAKTH